MMELNRAETKDLCVAGTARVKGIGVGKGECRKQYTCRMSHSVSALHVWREIMPKYGGQWCGGRFAQSRTEDGRTFCALFHSKCLTAFAVTSASHMLT